MNNPVTKILIKVFLFLIILPILSSAQPVAPGILTPANFSQDVWIGLTRFSWTESAGATSYTLEISTDNLFPSIFHTNTVNINRYDFSGLNPTTGYYYRVKANGPGGSSAWSPVGAFFTSTVASPAAPVLTAPTNNTLNTPVSPTSFSWTNIDGVTAWQVQIASDNSFGSIINDEIVGTNVYNYSGLNNNTVYYWRVQAAGGTNWSPVWNFSTESPAFLLPPVLLSPDNTSWSNDINPTTFAWTASAGANNYNIQIAIDNNFNTIIINQNTSATTFNATGLWNFTKYYWRVNATNGVLTSSWSGIWSFTTIPPVPPVPMLSSPLNGESDVPINPTTLKWANDGVVNGFNIQLAKDSNFTNIVKYGNADATPLFRVNELSTSTKYFWRVNAENDAGKSAWSAVWKFTTVPPKPIAPILSSPINNSKNFDTRSINFSWNAVEGASSYKIQTSLDSLFFDSVNDTITSKTNYTGTSLWSLMNNRTIFWRVMAINAGGSSPWSSVWKLKTQTGTPQLISPADSAIDIRDDSAYFAWSSVDGATHYRIQVYLDSSLSNPYINAEISNPNYTAKLMRALKCFWKVQSIGNDGDGSWSKLQTFRTLPNPPDKTILQSPADKEISVATNPAVLAWNPVPGASSYRLQVSDAATFSTLKFDTSISGNIFKTDSLVYDKLYYWRISAKNSGGSGVWSDTWNFRAALEMTELFSPTNDTLNVDEFTPFVFKSHPLYSYYVINITLDTTLTKLEIQDGIFKSIYSSCSSNENIKSIIPTNLPVNLKANTTYYWRGRYFNYRNNNTGNWTPYRKFTSALDEPVPKAPPNDSYTHKVKSVKISWQKVSGITYYRFQISRYADFSNLIQNAVTTDSSITVENLEINCGYYWRVRSEMLPQLSPWSSVSFFFNGNETMITPKPITPTTESNFNPPRYIVIDFQWSETPYSWKYVFQIAKDSLFKNLMIQDTAYGYTTLRHYFDYGNTYYWRVKAMNGDSSTAWSKVNDFSTLSAPPAVPILKKPIYLAYGAYNTSEGLTFEWDAVPGAKRYHLQVLLSTYSTSQQWEDSYMQVDNDKITNTSYKVMGLSPSSTFYWRVSAINNAGQSGWSEPWLFYSSTGIKLSPILISPGNNSVIGSGFNLNFSWKPRSFGSKNLKIYYLGYNSKEVSCVDMNPGFNNTDVNYNFSTDIFYHWYVTVDGNVNCRSEIFTFNKYIQRNWSPAYYWSYKYTKSKPAHSINSAENTGNTGKINSLILKPPTGIYDFVLGTDKGVFSGNSSGLNKIGTNGDSLGKVNGAIYNKQGDLFASAVGGLWRLTNNEIKWNLVYPYEGEIQLFSDTSLAEIRMIAGNIFIKSRNAGKDWDLVQNFSGYSDSLSFTKLFEPENNSYLAISKISDQSAGKQPEIFTGKENIYQPLHFNGKDGVTSITSLVAAGDNGIIIGTEKGLYKYNNGWNAAALSGGVITSLMRLKNDDIIASCIGKPMDKLDDTTYNILPGIYRSRDNGVTWSLISEGIPDAKVTCMGYSDNSELILGTENGYLFNKKYNTSNTSPNFTSAINDTIISVGQKISLLFSADDDNLDSLSFKIENKPDSAIFEKMNNTVSRFEWIPEKTGIYSNIKISVSDGLLTNAKVFKINVITNRAPVISTNQETYEIKETQPLIFDIKYSDADGDLLNFMLSSNLLNLGVKVDSTDVNTKRFTWTPSTGQAGSYILGIVVSDGKSRITKNITILVKKFNNPPDKFTLIDPTDNSTLNLFYPFRPITFKWQKSVDPDSNDFIRYNFKLKGQTYSIDTTLNLFKSDTISFTLDIMSKLKPSENYEWYVIASDGDTSVESNTRSEFRTSSKVNSIERENRIPERYELCQNYPNPFNPATTIIYKLPFNSYVNLKIYNILGKEVITLVSENQQSGQYKVTWYASNVPSGVYLYYLTVNSPGNNFKDVKKMMLIK